jgi:hypothetical protein
MLVRQRIAGLWLERDGFEEGTVAEGVVEREGNGFDASVYDGLGGGRLGSRGVALYIIGLTPGSARHFVVFFGGWDRTSPAILKHGACFFTGGAQL